MHSVVERKCISYLVKKKKVSSKTVHQIKPENLVDVSLTNINNRSVSDSISKKMITNDDIDKIEQKVEHYNEDGSNNSGRKSTTRLGDVANRLKNICSAGIDAVSDGLGRATISNDNDDDDALFKDPPPISMPHHIHSLLKSYSV